MEGKILAIGIIGGFVAYLGSVGAAYGGLLLACGKAQSVAIGLLTSGCLVGFGGLGALAWSCKVLTPDRVSNKRKDAKPQRINVPANSGETKITRGHVINMNKRKGSLNR